MPEVALIEGLTDVKCRLAIDAAQALQLERGQTGNTPPSIAGYGLGNIEWLTRRFGGDAPYRREGSAANFLVA